MTDYSVTVDYFVLTGSDAAMNRRKDGADNGWFGTLVIDGIDHTWKRGSRLRVWRGHGDVRRGGVSHGIALSKRDDAKEIRQAINTAIEAARAEAVNNAAV